LQVRFAARSNWPADNPSHSECRGHRSGARKSARGRELLLELAERVDSRGPVGVEGLGLTSLLIGDRASPLYEGDARRSIPAAAFTALVALGRGYPTVSTPTAEP
jgi:hypothetical protein